MSGNALAEDALASILEELLSDDREQVKITTVKSTRAPISSTHPIDKLVVETTNGVEFKLLRKDLTESSVLEGARRVRPSFLGDSFREIEVYSRILTPNGIGPKFCGAVFQESHAWIFLELLDARELYQTDDVSVWIEVARWLAAMHDDFASRVEALSPSLLKYDREYFRIWLPRALEFVKKNRPARQMLQRLSEHYEEVTERISNLPTTFIHGEFYASNVMIEQDHSVVRVVPVDWEVAGIGSGLLDLAALVSGWNEDVRKELAVAYFEAGKYCGKDVEAFLTDLDHCSLHLCIQWLGWSQNWTPPPEHGHDWLAEAAKLADRLVP